VKALATEKMEQLLSTIRICVLYECDTLGIVATGEKAPDHLCDSLQPRPSVCWGVFLLIVFGKLSEAFFEIGLKDVRSTLSVDGGRMREVGIGSPTITSILYRHTTGESRMTIPR
jgi:hypothetical protein